MELYAEAIDAYTRAIRFNPESIIAFYNRGLAKEKLGQYADAIQDFDTAARFNPNDPEIPLLKAGAKLELDREREAEQDLRTALKLAKKKGDADLITHIEKILCSLKQ